MKENVWSSASGWNWYGVEDEDDDEEEDDDDDDDADEDDDGFIWWRWWLWLRGDVWEEGEAPNEFSWLW